MRSQVGNERRTFKYNGIFFQRLDGCLRITCAVLINHGSLRNRGCLPNRKVPVGLGTDHSLSCGVAVKVVDVIRYTGIEVESGIVCPDLRAIIEVIESKLLLIRPALLVPHRILASRRIIFPCLPVCIPHNCVTGKKLYVRFLIPPSPASLRTYIAAFL